MRVTCLCCHHVEGWTNQGKTLLMEGGLRTPHPHPTLAAWRSIQRAWRGEVGPVVGTCPHCEQPLFGADPGPWHPWMIILPDGRSVRLNEEGLSEGGKPIDADTVGDILEEAWGERWLPRQMKMGQAAFEGGVLTMMLFPFLAWCIAVGSVVIYLLNFSGVPF